MSEIGRPIRELEVYPEPAPSLPEAEPQWEPEHQPSEPAPAEREYVPIGVPASV